MSTNLQSTPILVPGASFLSLDPTQTFTPEDFSSDERLMVETAEEFSRKEVLPVVDRIDAQEDGLMPRLIRKAGDLGLCGVDTSETYGGLGLGKNVAARILEFMSLNGSFSVTYGITSGISQVGLSLFGSEAQREQYLPQLASGEWIGAYALSEPNSGSDALSATTRAEQRGDKWILNGTKMWISNAKWANLFLVMAKIDGEKFSAFLVERDHPGVSISREEHKMGLKGSSTARLVLENAEIPVENLLYEPGLGHHVAFNALNIGRFKLSSMSIGPARDAMGCAGAYAKDRKQFGKSISEFGLIQKKLATMAGLFFVSEAMIYRTGALIDQAFESLGGTITGNRKAAEEYAIECSACKVFTTEAEAWIIDEALQIYGGYGFTEEFPIARHYRDSRISRIYEGTNEINRVFLADRFKKLIKSGSIGPLVETSYFSRLAVQALSRDLTTQVEIGAASDLILLSYAYQSGAKRAERTGVLGEELMKATMPYLLTRAIEAASLVIPEQISVPAMDKVDYQTLSEAVIANRGPIRFN